MAPEVSLIQTYVQYLQGKNRNANGTSVKPACKHGGFGAKAVCSALGPIIPIRRMTAVPDKVANKDYFGAAGTIAVAGILLPEDLRDTRDGARQVLHKFLPASIRQKIEARFPEFYKRFINYAPKYIDGKCIYRNFQTPFSFIRGSFLEPLINTFMVNKWGHALYHADKTLLDTKFGKMIMKWLGVEKGREIFNGRIVKRVEEENGKYIVKKMEDFTKELKGSRFGKLICRAMQRITVFGALALCAISVPLIIKSFIKPENAKDKIKNGSKQTLKSTTGIVSTISGIALGGALLAPLGPAGSALGMAIGSIVAIYLSSMINKKL